MKLIEKIKAKKAKLGVIGLGYVGLPLAVEFAKVGFDVIGIDINETAVTNINQGFSNILDVPNEVLNELVKKGKIKATTDYSIIKELDTINICVPTPLRKTKEPDVSFILSAMHGINDYLHKDMLILLESTTYPGTTDELLRPLIEEKNLTVGKDIFLAFSPERVDPSNKKYQTKNTPKVVGGVTPACVKVAKTFYEQAIDTVVPVSSTQAAELVKLLENTFRAVNIGLANELALLCEKFNIDVWEVIDAAATKPFGFMPFYPGPGLGGHCIPIDPYYLSWKAKSFNFQARFIELAGEINSLMPTHIVDKSLSILNNHKKCLNGSKVLILGIAYKPDVSDVRESPALEIIEEIRKNGAKVFYNDPYVKEIIISDKKYKSVPLTEKNINSFDLVIITTNHSSYDYEDIVSKSQLVFDTRNATKHLKKFKKKIIKL
jgi:UDP-N-acetyl-D-glucosamine dehydrogenase